MNDETSPLKEPRVSVVIVNWNGKHHLGECLGSLRAQAFKDFLKLRRIGRRERYRLFREFRRSAYEIAMKE